MVPLQIERTHYRANCPDVLFSIVLSVRQLNDNETCKRFLLIPGAEIRWDHNFPRFCLSLFVCGGGFHFHLGD